MRLMDGRVLGNHCAQRDFTQPGLDLSTCLTMTIGFQSVVHKMSALHQRVLSFLFHYLDIVTMTEYQRYFL